ncbi:plasmid recombination protein [Thiomonas intermedia]|uniref:plasmid recombination protein n=1 Tax=Thiomonas intermedia TaxID=926 RepID=UPI0009A544AB|nr:plasmid recombination protein [Thiomonas intermedia]
MSSIEAQEERMARMSVRLQAVPQSRLAFVAKHNLRIGRPPQYVDPERSHLNRVLFGPASGDFKAAAHACAERYRQRVSQKLQPKQAVLAEGIITFSRAAQHLIAQNLEQAHACALHLVQAIVRDHGHGTELVSVVYHGDESAPHYHFTLGGTGADGLSVLQRLRRREGVHIQDLAGQAFASMGIRRGIPVIDRIQRGDDRSKTVHRSVRQLHQDLPREIARVQQQLDAETARLAALQDKARKTRSRLEKAKADLDTLQAQADADTAKVAKLQERVKDYSARYAKQMQEIQAIAPTPVDVPVVTGTEKGLLGSRPTVAEQRFYAPGDVERFTQHLNRTLLREKDLRREAEQQRDLAQHEVERLRSILSPYPQLGWRLQSRRGGVVGAEQGCLIHRDQHFVYAVEPKTGNLLEGPLPRGLELELEHGMVLEFSRDRVRPPDQATIATWNLEQVIAAIEERLLEKMPSDLDALKAQLQKEQAERAKHMPLEEFGSDLDPTQEGTVPAPNSEPINPRLDVEGFRPA